MYLKNYSRNPASAHVSDWLLEVRGLQAGPGRKADGNKNERSNKRVIATSAVAVV